MISKISASPGSRLFVFVKLYISGFDFDQRKIGALDSNRRETK
jgi:hypothetical protein